MENKPKINLAIYWGAACGGCCVSVLDVHESLFDVVAAADLVFWPIALDFKYKKLDECNKKQSVSVSRPEYDEGKGKWIVDYDVYKIKYEEL